MQLKHLYVRFKLMVEIVLLCNLAAQSRLLDFKSTIEIHYCMKLCGSLTTTNIWNYVKV
jgi:hypothetical protein